MTNSQDTPDELLFAAVSMFDEGDQPDPNIIDASETNARAVIEAEGLVGYTVGLFQDRTLYILPDEEPGEVTPRVGHVHADSMALVGLDGERSRIDTADRWWIYAGDRNPKREPAEYVEQVFIHRGCQ
jgi:hypothetical protein